PLDAIDFTFNDVDVKESDDYPKFKRSHTLDEEKCVKCFLCEETCPKDAIEANVTVKKKEEIVKYPEGVSFKDLDIKGDIKIDYEKCTYCKLCDKLCDALEIIPTEASPLNVYAGKRIEVYLDECDYCGLCEEICPVDAIEVSCETPVEREIGEISVEGSIDVDEDKCIYCNWCGTVCFEDAIKVEKEFEGELILQKLEQCDPMGCQACIKICPTKAWYIPQGKDEEKIAVDEDFCIYCGSCELSCPEDCIVLNRENVRYEEFNKNTPWAKSWLEALETIKISHKIEEEFRDIHIEEEEEAEESEQQMEEIPAIDPELEEKVQQNLNVLEEILAKPPTRFFIEGKIGKPKSLKRDLISSGQ
ncbi:MAG: 4Fe-4S dicluster domain-containing protein, partial [Promethearchaeota archaeon]